jgi:hypothetical protein
MIYQGRYGEWDEFESKIWVGGPRTVVNWFGVSSRQPQRELGKRALTTKRRVQVIGRSPAT